MNKKVGRNDPCPCGSGKKYKKCCEQRLGGRSFSASIISSGKGEKQTKATQISTNFFSKLSAPKPSEPEKKEEDKEIEEDLPPEEPPKHPPEADKPM